MQIDAQTKPVLTSSFFSIAVACLGAREVGGGVCGGCVTKGRPQKLLMQRRRSCQVASMKGRLCKDKPWDEPNGGVGLYGVGWRSDRRAGRGKGGGISSVTGGCGGGSWWRCFGGGREGGFSFLVITLYILVLLICTSSYFKQQVECIRSRLKILAFTWDSLKGTTLGY